MKHKIVNVSFNRKEKYIYYPIFVGEKILSNSGDLLKQYINNKKIIIVHDNFFGSKAQFNKEFNQFLNSIKQVVDTVDLLDIPGGDQTKNMPQLTKMIEKILSYRIDRSSIIIAFGGGVVGDIAGFIASVLLRGINFIQIPTTLLSQVDSSVGGKTGVNSKIGKNLIGSFHQPLAVVADTNILKYLPERELRAGFAEVIKYGLIKDLTFFKWLENECENILNCDQIKLQNVITKSCDIKAKIIQDDEKENGKRALLNLGHTFAHAIEAFGNYDGRIIHGEAVSIGICLAFKFSYNLGFCSKFDTQRVINIFKKSKLPTSLSEIKDLSISTSEMIEKFKYDKKTRQNNLTFILNHKIGKSFIKQNIDVDTLTKFLNEEL
ncbi:3-dehydroquinate synthase [Alphaproteobacteria bacterium]|nr:3-dehydroquinate synthase [Alphaproteobacteria bacterium]